MRIATVAQYLDDVLFALPSQAVRGIAAEADGNPAIDELASCKIGRISFIQRFFLKRQGAWCMTAATVAKPLNQMYAPETNSMSLNEAAALN
ncbi:hypothetical protein [Pseudomonas sp. CC120222-01a]|uniref:hypothetical protein n=1 Tax=Pseudomonas sp. CC120222-01a TaxID=1378075 RepID=UPI000D8B1CCC|nr:hypothetical protein [Pseudomonas sp. CC120222-01a]PVZ36919.1 hypothetical protein N430_04689 [Pseudomonas sp. CC120222-01a]